MNIGVLPKPAAGRYAAFTIGADACQSVQGIGLGVLVAGVTVNKTGVLIRYLESNARVTLVGNYDIAERVTCNNPAGDTGFTIGSGAAISLFGCRVVATTGIALDLGSNAQAPFISDFTILASTGVNLIKAISPQSALLQNISIYSSTPTGDGILLQSAASPGTLRLINASLVFVVAAGFRALRFDGGAGFVNFMLFQNLSGLQDDGASAGIYIDNPAGLVLIDGLDATLTSFTEAIELPATSVGTTIIEHATIPNTSVALVTGTGKWQGTNNTAGVAILADRYEFGGANPSADNTRAFGTSVLAFQQMWAYIHGIKNYAEFRNAAAPAIGASMARAYADGGWLKHKSSALQVNAPLSHVGNLSTTPVTVANVLVETVLGTFTIPANAMVVGKTLRITARGVYDTDALGPTLELRVRWGGVAGVLMATDGGAALNAIVHTNRGWEVSFDACFVTVGAAGTAECQGFATLADTPVLTAQRDMENAAVIAALPTNASKAFVLTAQWGTADPANSITIRQWIVEVLN